MKKCKNLSLEILKYFADLAVIPFEAFWNTPYKGASPKDLHNTIMSLQRSGYIERRQKHQKIYFQITPKGKKHLDFKIYPDSEKPKWDGKWRLLIFDVPEEKKKTRDYLRNCLKQLDFYQLQKSVWVTPYPVPDFLDDIIKDAGLLYSIRYVVVESVNYDRDLRRYFGLG